MGPKFHMTKSSRIARKLSKNFTSSILQSYQCANLGLFFEFSVDLCLVFLLIKNPINRLRLHQLLGTKTTGGPPLTRKSLTRSKAIETCMISLIMDIKKNTFMYFKTYKLWCKESVLYWCKYPFLTFLDMWRQATVGKAG